MVPDVIGLRPAAATSRLGDAGLSPQLVSSDAPESSGGTVTGSDPSPGVTVAVGAPVSLTVADRVATTPTAPVDPSTCASGNIAHMPTTQSGSICIRVGYALTVTFQSSGSWAGYGSWSRWPPTISDSSTLRGVAWTRSGTSATAVFRAAAVGTAADETWTA